MNSSPIGIFDSGIGGLTVAREIIDLLPNESIIYLGDTARVPYGTRGQEVITQFAKELVNFLLKYDVKVLVAACNTISATCLSEIQAISPVPIIGVIKPASQKAVETTKLKSIGVIGTRATINSNAYQIEIQKLDPDINIISLACPLFVPIAEEGLGNHKVSRVIAEEYLEKFNSGTIDTLVLGCTHYPILKEVIQKTVGRGVHLIDSAKPTAEVLKNLLEDNNLLTDSQKADNQFLVTDAPERVKEVASLFFGAKLFPEIKKISL